MVIIRNFTQWCDNLKCFFLIRDNTYFVSSKNTASKTEAAYCRFFCSVSAAISPICNCFKRHRSLLNKKKKLRKLINIFFDKRKETINQNLPHSSFITCVWCIDGR